MILKRIKILSKEGMKSFKLYPKTIIYSKENSVGKSTLLRMIFYGLGYAVPGTLKLKFKNLKIWVYFERDGKEYVSYRKNNYLELRENDSICFTQAISNDMNLWFSNIWGITSPEILDNLLGAIYMDQDKGWTLLNRGKVIGNIKFNVRDLLIGLSTENTQIINLLEEQKRLIFLRKKVSSILDVENLAKYSSSSQNEIKFKNTDDLDNLNKLKVEAKYLKTRISKLKKQLKQNKGLEQYLYDLNLLVKNPENPERPILINRESNNLLNFKDNSSFIKMELVSLQIDLNDVEKKIAQLDNKLNSSVENLFEKQDIVEDTLNAFNKIKVDTAYLENKKDNLSNEISDLNEKIDSEFRLNKQIIDEAKGWIYKFADILGIKEIVTSNTEYIFTHDLKSLSGTEYYKVVFSFKMAYIKVIEEYTHEVLPIVLDSPSGREVNKRNIDAVIGILNRYFKENQILLASIYKYDLNNAEYIYLKERLFENSIKNSESINLISRGSD